MKVHLLVQKERGEERRGEKGEGGQEASGLGLFQRQGMFDPGIKVILNLIKSINDRASQENSQINYFHSSRG